MEIRIINFFCVKGKIMPYCSVYSSFICHNIENCVFTAMHSFIVVFKMIIYSYFSTMIQNF